MIRIAQEKAPIIANFFENREFSKAMIEIRNLADLANRFFDEKKPWDTIKSDQDTTRGTLTTVVNLFRIIAIFLKPILPSYCQKVEDLLGEEPFHWDSYQVILENRSIKPFEHLAKRIQKENIVQWIGYCLSI